MFAKRLDMSPMVVSIRPFHAPLINADTVMETIIPMREIMTDMYAGLMLPTFPPIVLQRQPSELTLD